MEKRRTLVRILKRVLLTLLVLVLLNGLGLGLLLRMPPLIGLAWGFAIGTFVMWSHFRRSGNWIARYSDLRLSWPTGRESSLAIATIGTLMILVGTACVADLISPPVVLGDEGSLKLALEYQQSVAGWLALAVMTVLVLPAVEELCFRGYIQGAIEARVAPWVAIVSSSALFASMHLGRPHWSLLLVPLALGLGAGAAVFLLKSIWPGIITHCVWNLAMVISASLTDSPVGGFGTTPVAVVMLTAAVSLLLGTALWYVLISKQGGIRAMIEPVTATAMVER